jgi:hypothetical protein
MFAYNKSASLPSKRAKFKKMVRLLSLAFANIREFSVNGSSVACSFCAFVAALADHCYADVCMRPVGETAARGKAAHKTMDTAQEEQLTQQELTHQEECMEFISDKTEVATDYVNANPIPSERTNEDNHTAHSTSPANRFQSKHSTKKSEQAEERFHSSSIPQSNTQCSGTPSQLQATHQLSMAYSTTKHNLSAPNVLVFCSSSNPSQNPVVTAVSSPASAERTLREASCATQKPLAPSTVPSSLPASQTLHPKPAAALLAAPHPVTAAPPGPAPPGPAPPGPAPPSCGRWESSRHWSP